MQEKRNNLMQEELYFKEQLHTEVPSEVEEELDMFIYSLDYKSDEAILRKFAFSYILASAFLLVFFHQLGAGWFSFDVSSLLDILGIAKHFVCGLCFASLNVVSIIVFKFSKEDLELLLTTKNKELYAVIVFSLIIFSMWGNEFSFAGAFLWLLGAYLGTTAGLNFGLKYLEERDKS